MVRIVDFVVMWIIGSFWRVLNKRESDYIDLEINRIRNGGG